MWTIGLTLRWIANVNLWHWRMLLPISAGLELAAFLIFFRTVSGHRRKEGSGGMETWMKIVIASTIGFLLLLLTNLGVTVYLALQANGPNIPHWFDQRYLVLATWGFPVLAVWGFNARWLPVFLGLPPPSGPGLLSALSLCAAGVLSALCGYFPLAAACLVIASSVAIASLNVFEPSLHPPKTQGVHPSFPWFIRGCYLWLLAASVLSLWAATADRNGGIWGASRHALTVGFLASMIFAIGPRVLPAFCGMRQLFSSQLMFASLLLLNIGCLLRVSSEIPSYEGFSQSAWRVLPVSAVVELTAVSLFALNLALTIASQPPHLKQLHQNA
jgi:hypothetical protein